MPSFQNSAPGSKSEKFVDGLNSNVNNIFAPFLADPGDLGGGGGGGTTTNNDFKPESLSSEFDTRLRLQEKRGGGGGGGFIPQDSNNGMAAQQQQNQNNQVKNDRPVYSIENNNNNNEKEDGDDGEDDDESSEEDYDYLLDDDENGGNGGGGGDPVLAAIRQKRLNELKRQHTQQQINKSRGHGEYRIITQDEFLPECCTSSKWVVVHFFHDEFERCKIMDYHLKRIAKYHLNCKFVGVDASKCPFFVQKLQIKTLPTLIVFKDGKAIDRLLGFDGLSTNPKNKPDEFSTSSLGRWIESTKAIDEYLGPDDSDDDDDDEENNKNSRFHTYDEDN